MKKARPVSRAGSLKGGAFMKSVFEFIGFELLVYLVANVFRLLGLHYEESKHVKFFYVMFIIFCILSFPVSEVMGIFREIDSRRFIKIMDSNVNFCEMVASAKARNDLKDMRFIVSHYDGDPEEIEDESDFSLWVSHERCRRGLKY